MSPKEMALTSSSGWSVIVTKPEVKHGFNAADIQSFDITKTM